MREGSAPPARRLLGEGGVAEGLADQDAEAVEGLADVGRVGAQEDADSRRHAQHGASSRVRRSWRSWASS